jgi:uncharacterized spore protein YtfJ
VNPRDAARELFTSQRVVGDPIERDGVTLVPVVRIRGGVGGGDDGRMGADRQPAGGGGAGVTARPVGAYVIANGTVTYEPALDMTRIILGGQLVALLALWVLRGALRRR